VGKEREQNYRNSFAVVFDLTLYLDTEFIVLNGRINQSVEQLTIGELAKRARINLETIRYYERQELLPKPPRLHSGYWAFPSESVRLAKLDYLSLGAGSECHA
jgi:hypothetical protein